MNCCCDIKDPTVVGKKRSGVNEERQLEVNEIEVKRKTRFRIFGGHSCYICAGGGNFCSGLF